ncbi:adenylosuccinate synthetase, chloroplastic-like [Apium graveolens]|uniref:adenylosuccinate synthetase, chloroplastic-like n=1 Tax=Apium graveolens TaxID=4045 RepID=UPI003D7C0A2E
MSVKVTPPSMLEVEYEKMPGWQSDISSIRNYSDLPKAARDYVERIEELVGVPVHYKRWMPSCHYSSKDMGILQWCN